MEFMLLTKNLLMKSSILLSLPPLYVCKNAFSVVCLLLPSFASFKFSSMKTFENSATFHLVFGYAIIFGIRVADYQKVALNPLTADYNGSKAV